MSFDTTFDFTPLITSTQTTITNLNASVALLTQKQLQLEQIQGYSEYVTLALNNIVINISGINTQLNNSNNFLAVIATIQSLDDISKQTLYQFFAFTSLDAATYTSRLTRNYQAMLSDSDIISLNADEVNSVPLKVIVGGMIVANYL